jgi:hypothetical protein
MDFDSELLPAVAEPLWGQFYIRYVEINVEGRLF